MASPFSKTSFYVSMVLILISISAGFYIFANDLNNNPSDLVVLDNKSVQYLNEYNSNFNTSGFLNYTEINRDTYSDDSIIATGNVSGTPTADGFLATVQYAQTFIVKIISTVYLIYNAPAFLFAMAGLPITPFSFLANIFSGAVYIAIIIMFVKLMNISSGD